MTKVWRSKEWGRGDWATLGLKDEGFVIADILGRRKEERKEWNEDNEDRCGIFGEKNRCVWLVGELGGDKVWKVNAWGQIVNALECSTKDMKNIFLYIACFIFFGDNILR